MRATTKAQHAVQPQPQPYDPKATTFGCVFIGVLATHVGQEEAIQPIKPLYIGGLVSLVLEDLPVIKRDGGSVEVQANGGSSAGGGDNRSHATDRAAMMASDTNRWQAEHEASARVGGGGGRMHHTVVCHFEDNLAVAVPVLHHISSLQQGSCSTHSLTPTTCEKRRAGKTACGGHMGTAHVGWVVQIKLFCLCIEGVPIFEVYPAAHEREI
jgi:hypothetical protein